MMKLFFHFGPKKLQWTHQWTHSVLLMIGIYFYVYILCIYFYIYIYIYIVCRNIAFISLTRAKEMCVYIYVFIYKFSYI
jgi:hypothetical protein